MLIAVLATPVGTRLARYRRTRLLAVTAGLWTARGPAMAVLPSGDLTVLASALAAATLLFTAAELLHAPASQALAASIAPAAARGRHLATFQCSSTLATIVAPAFAATYEVDSAAPRLVLAAANALSIVGVVWLERHVLAAVLRDAALRSILACDHHPVVLEHALLSVRPGQEADFEAAFDQAKAIIARMSGFAGLTLSRCVERPGTYLLLVDWQRLEDHTEGFRGSPEYGQWRDLLHRFYEPFPAVEHYELVHTA